MDGTGLFLRKVCAILLLQKQPFGRRWINSAVIVQILGLKSTINCRLDMRARKWFVLSTVLAKEWTIEIKRSLLCPNEHLLAGLY